MLSHLQVLREIWRAPGNQPRRLHAVWRAFRWFLRCHLRAGSGPVLLAVFGARLYPCHTESIIAKHVMYRSEWYDWDLMQFINGYLQQGEHFLDVGANTGLHTLLASTRTSHITCVEPEPSNVQRLRHTLEVNHLDGVTVLALAASDAAGEVCMEGNDVFARITSPAKNPQTVPAARLDEVLDPQTPVDLCKLDVEGAEWLALRGMTGLMQRGTLPVLAFEHIGHLHAFGQNEGDFLEWLRAQGYTLGVYKHEAHTLDLSEPFTGTDLIAFTQKGRRMIENRLSGMRWLKS
ncbi:MAG TPA: hypothetical protein DIT13_13660 [Verrucomicrobiales bacterium]|nr:hypothetical protein [Verrucomicrobiales bacterium]HRJ09073.1 FkbM family methyltransferase [Prosthecobacter sp.]HRK14156.1 FkbM family methyltransferase [Prosthecobacter sp.]